MYGSQPVWVPFHRLLIDFIAINWILNLIGIGFWHGNCENNMHVNKEPNWLIAMFEHVLTCEHEYQIRSCILQYIRIHFIKLEFLFHRIPYKPLTQSHTYKQMNECVAGTDVHCAFQRQWRQRRQRRQRQNTCTEKRYSYGLRCIFSISNEFDGILYHINSAAYKIVVWRRCCWWA